MGLTYICSITHTLPCVNSRVGEELGMVRCAGLADGGSAVVCAVVRDRVLVPVQAVGGYWFDGRVCSLLAVGFTVGSWMRGGAVRGEGVRGGRITVWRGRRRVCYTQRYMDIVFVIQVVQTVSAILLIIAILLQRSEAGLGGAFGGGDMSESGSVKRRGSEKVVFIGSIVLAVVFVGSIILPFVI